MTEKPDLRRFGTDFGTLTIERGGKTIRRPRMSGRVKELANDHSSRTHPWPADKPGTNWVEEQGGLPSFIKRVAKHIMADSGYTQSRAIAAAVSQCKKGRLGAKGLAAYAEFRAKAAAARAS